MPTYMVIKWDDGVQNWLVCYYAFTLRNARDRYNTLIKEGLIVRLIHIREIL